MADVAIIHAADKGTAAARLADAIAAAGFAVDPVEVADPAALADLTEGCAADARILIWSRALVSHALHSGELNRIRQLSGLIEVSADGITPPSRGDDSRVVSISGWRGQPYHPGWQRIHVELKRLCGTRKAVPGAVPAPVPARDAKPKRAGPADPGGGGPQRTRRLMLGGGAAVLLLAAAVGAASWVGREAPDAAPRQSLAEPSRPAGTAEDPRSGLGAPPPSAAPSATVPKVGDPTAPVPAASSAPPPETAAAKARPEASRAVPAVRPQPRRPAARPEPRPSPGPAPVKKYSRKNSKVMREFCQRSGRSTPQCRTFLRSQAIR
ncbi:MAG TPA: hypothetical protein VE891_06365 [Allosphingosinicella sp.]|nr:hypothetical protein [Allosphingosinicella sp.]